MTLLAGVILVAIEDGFEDELVVAGDGVDAAHFVDASTVIIPQHCCLVQCPTICYEQPQHQRSWRAGFFHRDQRRS